MKKLAILNLVAGAFITTSVYAGCIIDLRYTFASHDVTSLTRGLEAKGYTITGEPEQSEYINCHNLNNNPEANYHIIAFLSTNSSGAPVFIAGAAKKPKHRCDFAHKDIKSVVPIKMNPAGDEFRPVKLYIFPEEQAPSVELAFEKLVEKMPVCLANQKN